MKSRWRMGAFATLSVLVFVTILARLAQLQVVEADEWQKWADVLSKGERPIPARRGTVYDRNGSPLAVGERRYQVGVYLPERWAAPRRAESLASWLEMSAGTIRSRLRGQDGHVVLHRSVLLSPAMLDSIERSEGLTLERRSYRSYPLGDVAARFIGRVNRAGDGDAGLEQMLEEFLAGQPGTARIRYDGALRKVERERITIEEPIDGADVVLTLDKRVQMLAEVELKNACVRAEAERGLAMVIRIEGAELLASAEWPPLRRASRTGYDASSWQSRAMVAAFEPGSTFKFFTAASLLKRAVCDTATVFDGEKVPGKRRAIADLGGFTFRDVHPVGQVSLRHAFTVSSNIIFGKAAGLLRRSEFYDDLRRFGFGERSGLGWPGESAGILRGPDTWSERSQPTIAIGQEVSASLMQLANAYTAILGDGTLRDLRLVSHYVDATGHRVESGPAERRHRVVPDAVRPTLRALGEDVVQLEYGTGTHAAVSGLSVGGKTGTAQMVSPEGGYDPDRHYAGFVGFAPVEEPRVLVLVFLEGVRGQMRWGGQSAAPAVGRIFEGIVISTEHLDAAHTQLAVAESDRRMPNLAGRVAPQVDQLAAAEQLLLQPRAPNADAVVIGQLPAAGTPLSGGPVRVQLAWGSRAP